MAEQRPDPDQLLAQLKETEKLAARGRLKIFFGASAGVGKTYAMLAAAQTAKQQQVDVLIGVIETHGRAETVALTQGSTACRCGRWSTSSAPSASSTWTPPCSASRN